MSYIAQTYDPHVITSGRPSFERLRQIAELAKKDVFPGPLYNNYEVQIWVLMRECIDDAIDGRNRYETAKSRRKTSQHLQTL